MLAKEASRLNREAGAPNAPALYFLTDPSRTPDPVAIARRLPRGACVIYRHFGAANRARVARALLRVCRARGLMLLIAADPWLARRIGADGVHWPERRYRPTRASVGFTSVAAHTLRGVQRASDADACLLSPVFASASASAKRTLGLARAERLARASAAPAIALGGIGAHNAARLRGRGFSGLACVEALAKA